MQNQNKNHLSYFHNALKSDKNCENKPTKTKKRTHFAMSLVLSFTIVALCSFGMRFIEDNVINSLNQIKTKNQLNPFHTVVALAAENNNQAAFLVQSHKHVRIIPNKGFTFIVKFKNTGTKAWNKGKVYLKSLSTGLKFHHDYWPDPYHPGSLEQDVVWPGQEATFKFAVESPPNYGTSSGEFVLADDNVMIQNGEVSISMEVTDDPEKSSAPAPAPKPAPTLTPAPVPTPAPAPTPTPTPSVSNCPYIDRTSSTSKVTNCIPHSKSNGPLLRVGLYHSEDNFQIKNTKAWQLMDANNILLINVSANEVITVDYIEELSTYQYTKAGMPTNHTYYLKLKNINNGIWEIVNYDRRPSWNPAINWNNFSGDLEIRYNDSRERTWLIEEIQMENYLRGIAETSNGSPIEYLKTMTVAARTYAYYHYTKGTKHAHEYFHVDATYDQVYKGYASQEIMRDLQGAVDQTNGIIATYEGKPIVAAYFSRSDGRTRSFEEVWYNHVPYLVSVPCPYNEGKELWGHGVGIDATDAYHRADEGNASYDQILKYYYTGINLEKVW